MFVPRRMHVISRYLCDLCIYGGSRGKLRFLSGRSRDFRPYFSRLGFWLVGATIIVPVVFSAMATVLEFGGGFRS